MSIFGENLPDRLPDQFLIKQNGEVVLDVSVNGSHLGSTMQVKLNGQTVHHSQRRSVVKRYASFKHGVKLAFSKRDPRLAIGDKHAEKLDIDAGGLSLSIYTSKAAKFASQRKQAQYMHLNVQFDKGIPEGAQGIFAELAGLLPMTSATQALLKKPRVGRLGRH